MVLSIRRPCTGQAPLDAGSAVRHVTLAAIKRSPSRLASGRFGQECDWPALYGDEVDDGGLQLQLFFLCHGVWVGAAGGVDADGAFGMVFVSLVVPGCRVPGQCGSASNQCRCGEQEY